MPDSTTRRQFLFGSVAAVAVSAGCSARPPLSGRTSVTTAPRSSPAVRRGGTLRVGMLGGANDIVDGQYIRAKPDIARLVAGWEPLATYDEDFNVSTSGGLAEEIDSSPSADRYTIRIRDGIEFHDGKTLDADDVVYSFRRAIDPTLGINPALRALVRPDGIGKLDARTVDIRLAQPSVTFLDSLALYAFGMVPDGYSRDADVQVGTGPFRLESFSPGSESRHVRHPNYWGAEGPYLDEVRIIDFGDSTALVNALRAGELDCAIDVPYSLTRMLSEVDGLAILDSAGGNWLTITMAIDQPPFDDVRVRRAFRLMVDRDEVVERVFAGHGRVANDMYGPLDPCYAGDLPQRRRDVDQARALLAEAGRSGLEIDLFAPSDNAALADLASVFADHAKGAGVDVNVRVLPGAEYWGEEYCKRTFATGFWGTRSYLPQVPLSSLHDAVYPETHWPPARSDFAAMYLEAIATANADERCAIVRRMQEEEYRDGGNIIAAFHNLVDGHRTAVRGLVERPNVVNLDHFGHGFKNIWLDD
jgi:peptide/nickel transport system substrate-binding protein